AVFDIRDQLGLYPVHAAKVRALPLHVEGGVVCFKLSQELIQRTQALGRKPCADVARITELILVVIGAEQQCAETDPRIARIRKTAHDKLALLNAFYLQPVRGSAAAISRTAALGHDAFEAELTHLLEQLLALAFEMMHI